VTQAGDYGQTGPGGPAQAGHYVPTVRLKPDTTDRSGGSGEAGHYVQLARRRALSVIE